MAPHGGALKFPEIQICPKWVQGNLLATACFRDVFWVCQNLSAFSMGYLRLVRILTVRNNVALIGRRVKDDIPKSVRKTGTNECFFSTEKI